MRLGNSKRTKGAVLIFAVGVLTVLALLAAAFTSLSKIERNVSRNYVDTVRAKLLAQSGIEKAVMEVREAIQGQGIPPDQYSIAEDASRPWIYGRPAAGPPTPRAAFYNPTIPLEKAIFVSFGAIPATGRARTVRLDQRLNQKDPVDPLDDTYGNDEFGVSGFSAGTYTPSGDFYAVKVQDGGSMIYINGPDNSDDDTNPVQAAAISPLAPNVLLMLNNLSMILNRQGRIPFTDLGNRISNLRSTVQRNFMKADEIKSAFPGSPLQQDQYFQAVKPYITAAMWLDPSTLHPDALQHPRANDPNLIYNSQWRAGRTVMLGNEQNRRTAERTVEDGPSRQTSCGSDRLVADDRGDYAAHWQTAVNNWESPSQGAAIGPCRQPRAPVNINTAALETLEAVLTGLVGQSLRRNVSATEPRTYMGDGFSTGGDTSISQPIAQSLATAIAARRNELIMARGYGFASWYDFCSFIDAIDTTAQLNGLSPASSVAPVALSAAMKQVIKANANPNSGINKFNPDRAFPTRFADTDKADLVNWTTEFSFNSNGYFEIESVGRVCGDPLASGAMPVIAEKKISTAVKVYEVFRISTQKEFLVNRASGSGTPTSIAYYPENLMDQAGQTMSNWPNVAAEYDGYMELPTTDINGANVSGAPLFYAHYTDTLGIDAVGPAERNASLVSAGGGGSPNTGGQSEVFIDGLFSHETRRYPNYTNTSTYGAPFFGGNVDDYVRNARADTKIKMNEGTLEMWVKPTWGANEFANQLTGSVSNPRAEASRTFFSCGDGKLGTAYGSRLGPKDQSVCDNRVMMYARAEDGGTYIMASEATRLAEPWGWVGVMPAGPYPSKDLYYYWGKYHTNWYRMPNTAEKKYDTNMGAWSVRNWADAGNWHHLRFAWQNDRSSLFVDGQSAGDDPLTAGRAEVQTVAPQWSLFIGSSRFRENSTNGYPTNADCTIDDIRIYQTAMLGSFVPPPRFGRRSTYEGKIGPRQNQFGNNVIPFDYTGRVANIAWTCWMPRFNGLTVACTMKVKAGSLAYEAATPTLPGGMAYEQTCRGAGLNTLSVQPGQDVTYEVEISAEGTNRVASPILDDVTISVIPNAPKFLYYSME